MNTSTKKYFNSLSKVIRREFDRIINRRSLSALYFALPIVLFTFFSLIYQNELIRDIPIAVFDEDHSELSLLLTRYIESSSSMKITTYANSISELKTDFKQGKIRGAIYLPKNLEKNVKSGGPANVTFFINANNIIISNYLLSDGSKIIKTVSAGVLLKKLRSAGLMEQQSINILNPIRIDTQTLFNPNYSYKKYLVPGLTTFGYLLVIMMASVLIISSEFTHNTFNELAELSENKISIIVLGKSIPHIIIHIINLIILICLVFPIFNVAQSRSVLALILFAIFFSIVTLFLGFMISSIFHNQMFATELALFIITPAFILSGLTFPLWAMPGIYQLIAMLIPYTYFLSGFMKIINISSPIKYLGKEIIALSLFLIFSLAVTIVAIRYQLNKFNFDVNGARKNEN